MKRLPFVVVALVACSDPNETVQSQKNLDRPVDVSFACYGGLRITNGAAATADQPVEITAQPVEACNIRSAAYTATEPAPVPPGQEDIAGLPDVPNASWFAFVLQSGPGTVALARFETKPSANFGGGDVQMQDSDPLTPGKNSISVGEEPIAIATDRIGCTQVIANQGSCDLSVLDINSVFEGDPIVNRLEVKNATGQVIRARPAAMVMEPARGTIGQYCPGYPTQAPTEAIHATGLAYIAYPSCHLVAGVDVATGTIVTGVQFDATGVPTVVDGNVSCPAECDGQAPAPGVRPVTLDLEVDPRTGRVVLAIGADNSNVLVTYDLDTTLYRPTTLTQVPLQNQDPSRTLGITSVAVSPVIGMGGTTGVVNEDLATGGEHQFVYAVATDGSVRVVDITGANPECDTQVDPRYIRDVRDVSRLSCFPVGDPATPPRRTGVRGPGIELFGDAIPTSVDVFKVDAIPNDSRTPGIPQRMIGYFGVISGSAGQSYVFNIDNDDFADYVDPVDPLATQIPLVIAHQLRDNIPDRGQLARDGDDVLCNYGGPDPDSQNGNVGGPRIVGSPQHTVPSGVMAIEKTGGLPSIRQVLCDGTSEDRPVSELFFGAPTDVRESVFPDLRALRADENWSLTWEGSLSLDKADVAVDGPGVRIAQLRVDSLGLHVFDETRPYCDAGVEQFDVVQLRGCDPTQGDAGCPVGYTCYVHPQSQVAGIGACMLADEAERLATACKQYLTSLRRYTVGRTSSGELRLLPRKHVLRTTPIDGCIDAQQCSDLASYAIKNASPVHPADDNTPPDTHMWRCEVDPDRAPVPGTGKRCIMGCTIDADCSTGMVCGAGGYCMEGVVPPQSCVNAPQRYELRAGEAFTVVGTRHGYIHPMIADPGTDSCVRNPNASPLQIGRIPLRAPPCDPLANPRTGLKPDGVTYDANPCSVAVAETEYQLNYVPGTCTLGQPDELLVTRDAPALRFRNRAMTLTLVDPTYQGDLRCNGDRAGTLAGVPLVTPGYSIAFRQTAGFTPMIVPIQPSLPIKVLRGPTQSIWIVDEGDFLSTSITQASTRGKVFRVESRALAIINVLD